MNKYEFRLPCLTSLLERSKINAATTTSLRMTVHELSLLFYFIVDCTIIAASLRLVLVGGIVQSIQQMPTWSDGPGFETR